MSADTACAVGLIVVYLFTLGIGALILSSKSHGGLRNDQPTRPVDTVGEDAVRIHGD